MGVGVVTVFFSRLSSRSFHEPPGCTPTHPFVNTSAEYGSSRPGPKPGPAPRILCDRLALQGRLNQAYAPQQGGVHVAPQTGPAGVAPGRLSGLCLSKPIRRIEPRQNWGSSRERLPRWGPQNSDR